MRIFVSIASYRDPLLYDTITSLLDNQSGLCRITVGVFEQTKLEDSLAVKHPELLEKPNIKYKRIDPEYSEGVGWARYLNSLQMGEQDFYYQIDSHMLFDKNWDRELIRDYQDAARIYNNDKIVITANCKNFDLDANGAIVKHLVHPITTKALFYSFTKDYLLGAHGLWVESTPTVTDSIHIFAGNMFTRSDWVREVGMHPKIFFYGEEQYLVLASFAAGYKICHPREIHCYHYLQSNNYTTKQWIDPVIPQRMINMRQDRSMIEFHKFLLSIDTEILEMYRKYSGVDYINRKLEQRAITREIKPFHENDWEIPDRTD